MFLYNFFKPKQLRGAVGEFGNESSNPVPIKKGDSLQYLQALRDEEGNFLQLKQETHWKSDFQKEYENFGFSLKDFSFGEGMEKYTVSKGKLCGVELYLLVKESFQTSKRLPKGIFRNSKNSSRSTKQNNSFYSIMSSDQKGINMNFPIIMYFFSESEYLKRLRDENGKEIRAIRTETYLPENLDFLVREYEILAGDKKGVKLYFTDFSNFHFEIGFHEFKYYSRKEKAPKGFQFSCENQENTKNNPTDVRVSSETISRKATKFIQYSDYSPIKVDLNKNNPNHRNETTKLLLDSINYLDYYHPYRNGTNSLFNSFSSSIISLKKEEDSSIRDFYKRCFTSLDGDFDTMVIVPSHNPIKSNSGIRTLAIKLAKGKGWTDGTGCLKRTRKIDKLAYGGDRSLDVHLNSISITDINKIRGQKVLLIDDVTTSGNSLYASQKILRDAGATSVYMFALAKTSND